MWLLVNGDIMSALVFFFKHKTAYEMRISDWSSDVCSSDLLCGAGDARQQHHTGRGCRAALDEISTFDVHVPLLPGLSTFWFNPPYGYTDYYMAERDSNHDFDRMTGLCQKKFCVNGRLWQGLVRAVRDRKSTRLNSSH